MFAVHTLEVARALTVARRLRQIRFMSYDKLQSRMNSLDSEMEREIDELKRRYMAKRQPILDAMDAKRKRQQNSQNF